MSTLIFNLFVRLQSWKKKESICWRKMRKKRKKKKIAKRKLIPPKWSRLKPRINEKVKYLLTFVRCLHISFVMINSNVLYILGFFERGINCFQDTWRLRKFVCVLIQVLFSRHFRTHLILTSLRSEASLSMRKRVLKG